MLWIEAVLSIIIAMIAIARVVDYLQAMLW